MEHYILSCSTNDYWFLKCTSYGEGYFNLKKNSGKIYNPLNCIVNFILFNHFASTGKNVSGHQLGQTVVQLVSCLGKLVF